MAGRARHSRADDHGSAEYDPGLTPVHEVALAGLTPSTTYHFQVESLDVEFSTAPAQIDLSGWTLLQFDSSQAYVFPPGTAIPGGGYLVLARDSGQAAFEVEWGPLPAGTIFLSSGGSFPFINGGESFELRDGGSLPVDGVTIAMASGTSIQRNHPGDPPGDDGVDGTATSYDMRSAPHPITSEAGFAAATPLVGEPSPATAGTTEVWEVPGLTPATSYYFALRTSDEVGNFSALSNSLGGTTGLPGSGSGAPTADHLVISEIQTRGSLSHDDEFIELYNPTAVPADLTGWSLQYKSAGGTTFLVAPLPGAVIPAGGYFLTARPPGFYSGSVTPDAVNSSFAMSASGGHVFLVTSDSGLASCTGDCPEGSSAPVHAAGESLERAPGAADYKIRRATSPDFMQIQPIPDDTHLLDRTTGTTYLDTGSPAAGIVFFYFVNATDGGAGESDD